MSSNIFITLCHENNVRAVEVVAVPRVGDIIWYDDIKYEVIRVEFHVHTAEHMKTSPRDFPYVDVYVKKTGG